MQLRRCARMPMCEFQEDALTHTHAHASIHTHSHRGRRTVQHIRPVPPARITNTSNEIWQYKGMPPQNEDNEEILVDQLEAANTDLEQPLGLLEFGQTATLSKSLLHLQQYSMSALPWEVKTSPCLPATVVLYLLSDGSRMFVMLLCVRNTGEIQSGCAQRRFTCPILPAPFRLRFKSSLLFRNHVPLVWSPETTLSRQAASHGLAFLQDDGAQMMWGLAFAKVVTAC
eukprot:280840-Pelagomonas_calceolata.AAC.1